MIPPTDFNPMAQANRLMLRNLLQDALDQPWLSGLIALMILASGWLTGHLVLAVIGQRIDLLEWAFRDYALLVWAGLYTLSVASLTPLARRRDQAATSGWLATLPQMPRAGRRDLVRTLWLLCLLQTLLLLGLLALLAQHFSEPMQAFNWLLALAMPMAAGVTTMGLVKTSSTDPSVASTARRPGSGSARCGSAADILRQWQRAAFGQVFWAPATRWAIGGLLILIPAGASTAGVAITLVVGWTVIQAMNAWTSWMRVIVDASLLLRALPTNTAPLLWALSVWPLMLTGVGSLLLSLGLLALGASLAGVIGVMLVVPAVSLLAQAGVLAWRHQGGIPQWRILAVVLLWLLLAQSIPPAAPAFWLLLMFMLIKKASRR